MFLFRYTTNSGATWNALQLAPRPTEVDYPPYRIAEPQTTSDGAVVVQRPIQDSRPRKLIWRGYFPTIAAYESQWTTLLSLDARQRDIDGENPIIQFWEDETAGSGGFDKLTDAGPADTATFLGTPSNPSNLDWTSVKILQVTRTPRKSGGILRYDSSEVMFVIADPSWENF